jgi:hypothetical protein
MCLVKCGKQRGCWSCCSWGTGIVWEPWGRENLLSETWKSVLTKAVKTWLWTLVCVKGLKKSSYQSKTNLYSHHKRLNIFKNSQLYIARFCSIYLKSVITSAVVMRVHCVFSVLSSTCYGSHAVIAYPTQKQTMSGSQNTVPYNPVSYNFPTCAWAALQKVFQTKCCTNIFIIIKHNNVPPISISWQIHL